MFLEGKHVDTLWIPSKVKIFHYSLRSNQFNQTLAQSFLCKINFANLSATAET